MYGEANPVTQEHKCSSDQDPVYPIDHKWQRRQISNWIYPADLTLVFTVLVSIDSMILPQVHLRKPCYDFSFL